MQIERPIRLSDTKYHVKQNRKHTTPFDKCKHILDQRSIIYRKFTGIKKSVEVDVIKRFRQVNSAS